MRQDQQTKLEQIAERLADVFLVEADPDNWTGAGKMPADLSRDERGDRHWDRKGAAGTAGVLMHTLNLISHYRDRRGAGLTPEEAEADLEKTIQDAERRAQAAVDAAMKRARKAASAG